MKNVLVVDDSATMRRMVMASLASLGALQFEEAGSGLEAIERLGMGPVDLMILDINMPDMYGLEVLRFLRNYPRYGKIPVIVLTTRGDDGTQALALENGAALYLTKPFQPNVLVDHARRLLDTP